MFLKDLGAELVWLIYQSQIKAVIYRVTCTLVWEASTRFLQQQKMREHEMLQKRKKVYAKFEE
jgi:hypothetical protein